MASRRKSIKTGVIGYGPLFNMGKRHMQSMMDARGLEPVAVCDLDPARTAQAAEDFPGIETYNDVRKLLSDSEVELVTVITPHNVHAKLAIQCLKSGRHVVTEKPFCLTVKEADAMIAAAEKNDVMLSTFHNRRWDGDFMRICEVVRKGIIGEVFHVEVGGGHYGPSGGWRGDKSISGGALYDWGAHYTDWLLNLVDSPIVSVYGDFQERVWSQMTNEDHTHAMVRFANGCFGQVYVSHLDMAGRPRWRILGTKGAIVAPNAQEIVVHTEVKGIRAEMRPKPLPSDWDAYYRNVADHLVRGKPLAVTAEQARRVIGVIETAEKSAKKGKPLPVPHE